MRYFACRGLDRCWMSEVTEENIPQFRCLLALQLVVPSSLRLETPHRSFDNFELSFPLITQKLKAKSASPSWCEYVDFDIDSLSLNDDHFFNMSGV